MDNQEKQAPAKDREARQYYCGLEYKEAIKICVLSGLPQPGPCDHVIIELSHTLIQGGTHSFFKQYFQILVEVEGESILGKWDRCSESF